VKLATYRFADGIGPARVEGALLADLRGVARTMIELLETDLAGAASGTADIPLDPARLLAPVPQPRAFLGVGLNYRDHAAEVGRTLPDVLPVFAKLASAVSPPFATIARPAESFDYEGELGVVIGAGGSIAGYVVVNDLTIRAMAKPDTLVLGKSAPGCAPFGPWITTADEIPDPHALRIETRVNGEVRQSSSTAELHQRLPELLAYIGGHVTLQPGDIIATGSPAGSGIGFDPPRWLTPGDTVRVEIEHLGHIEHLIGDSV